MRNGICAILLLLILLNSCQQSSLNKGDLLKYLDDHESLSPKLTIKGLEAQTKFIPNELMEEQEWVDYKNNLRSTGYKDSLKNKYAGQYYFRLLLSINNKEAIRQLGSFDRYSEMLQVLAFQMNKYIQCITDGNDTLNLKDYAFEQTFGMTSANALLLVFDKKRLDQSNSFKILVQECGFGVGNMAFKYQMRDIQKIPKLEMHED